jgi:hypothetical protein
MGNCAGYCNGETEDNQGQIKNSFNKKDLQVRDNDFELHYGKRTKWLRDFDVGGDRQQ